MDKKLEEAVTTLCLSLKNDPELYYGWQSNIAMQFYDVAKDFVPDTLDLHALSDKAAKNFLDLLISTSAKESK